eukprot:GDKJ01017770.1.p1 GENE.GDKJ01017770.1~~GDKJ01017770.1.p1  ORF type:complete len:255 (-),score=48.18 GDKJ01017770.1:65-829(-)
MKFSEYEIDGVKLRCAHQAYNEDDQSDSDEEQLFEDFFDPDFNIAVATGYTKTWEGSFLLLDYLRSQECPIKLEGLNLVEMGSGSGMFGMCLAVMKNNVLLSDVECICRKYILNNLKGNSKGDVTDFFVPNTPAFRVGEGSTAVRPIDWNKELAADLDLSKTDMIVAAECVWLPDLLAPFSGCYARLLKACRPGTKGILCYPVRGTETSYFTTRSDLEKAMDEAGCAVEAIKVFPPQPIDPDVKETIIYIVSLK